MSEQDSEIERLRNEVASVQSALDDSRQQLLSLQQENSSLREEVSRIASEARTESVLVGAQPSDATAVDDKGQELETLKTEYNALKTKYTKALQMLKQLKSAAPGSSAWTSDQKVHYLRPYRLLAKQSEGFQSKSSTTVRSMVDLLVPLCCSNLEPHFLFHFSNSRWG